MLASLVGSAGELEAPDFAVTVSRGLALAPSFGSASGMVPVNGLSPLPFLGAPPSLVAEPLRPELVSGLSCESMLSDVVVEPPHYAYTC